MLAYAVNAVYYVEHAAYAVNSAGAVYAAHAVHAVQPQAKPVGQQKVIPTYDVQQSQQNPVQIVSPATQMVSPQGATQIVSPQGAIQIVSPQGGVKESI